MVITSTQFKNAFRNHWFYLIAAVMALSEFAVAALDSWTHPMLLEAGILFDLSIAIPALYLWCNRSRGWTALPRALALSCLGIWVAGHVVPSQHHQILSSVGFVRYIGLGVLLVIEIKLAAIIFRAAFRPDRGAAPAALAAAKDAGMPEWVARVMAWEASVWRKAWDSLRRIIARG